MPYGDREGVRIGNPCPLSPDIYTIFFISNVEHWYAVPIEHSPSEIDIMLSNVFTLFMGQGLLVSMILIDAAG